MSKKNKKKNRSSAARKQNTTIKPAEQAAAIDAEAEQASAADTVIEQAAIADSAANVTEEDTAKDTQVNEAVNESAAKKSSAKEKKQPSKTAAVHAEHADNSHILKPAVSYAYILILFVLLIVVFILKIMGDKELAAANERNAQLTAAILAASENIAQLSAENAEQKKQLDAMSTAINARSELNETQKKEEEESAMPILYPIRAAP